MLNDWELILNFKDNCAWCMPLHSHMMFWINQLLNFNLTDKKKKNSLTSFMIPHLENASTTCTIFYINLYIEYIEKLGEKLFRANKSANFSDHYTNALIKLTKKIKER